MKRHPGTFPVFSPRVLLCGFIAFAVDLLLPQAAFAQDSAFLACAQYTDRGQRIACLEDALEAATAAQATVINQSSPAPAATTAPAVVQPAAPPPPPSSQPQPATANETTASDPSLLDRLRGFGQRNTSARVEADAAGNDVLHDSITKLERRNNLWVVTLSSGQIWRQELPRTLNLRVGDEIIIEQGAGIGMGYRLSTPRLSGFIRVVRVQ
jgi:hypothetical protein